MIKKIKNLVIINVMFSYIIIGNIVHANRPQSNIITVNSIKEIIPYFEKTNKNTLVIFDIDSTLTTPSNSYLQRQTIQRYKPIYDSFINRLTENQYRIFLHLVIVDSPSILVEKEIPLIIKKLQYKGVKTIGYTGSKLGDLGNLPSFPDWRYNELKRLGIDFVKIFPGKVIFKEFQDLGGGAIGMEKGIVYSGYHHSKGSVLHKVLNELNWIPRKIIVIDDKEKNVVSFLHAIKNIIPEVNVIGFHYKGINFIPKANTDVKIFEKKLHHLIKETQIVCPEDSQLKF
jgi:hypothetical protein